MEAPGPKPGSDGGPKAIDSRGRRPARVLEQRDESTGPEPVADVDDRKINNAESNMPLVGKNPIRIYTPIGDGPFPVLLYFHGDGFVIADLDGLPPTIVTAEVDPLRDDGKLLAEHLKAGKVEVDHRHFMVVTHEFFGMGAAVDKAKEAVDYASTRLTRSFATNHARAQ